MPRRLLVVITTDIADSVLRDLVRTRAGDDAESSWSHLRRSFRGSTE